MSTEKRFTLFLVLSFAIVMANMALVRWLAPPEPPAAEQQAGDDGDAAGEQVVEADDQPAGGQPPAGDEPGGEQPALAAPTEEVEPRWVTLGSLDPASPYRMLVTLTNRGAAIETIELSSPRYRQTDWLEIHGGYLGSMAATSAEGGGALLHSVGPGTPAAKAGLEADDVITAIDGEQIADADALAERLEDTAAEQVVNISIRRGDNARDVTATLQRWPMRIVKAEENAQLSYLLTLAELDDAQLKDDEEELAEVALRSGTWEVLSDEQKPDEVAFRFILAEQQLEVIKRYRLARLPEDNKSDDAPAYHLEMDIEIRNRDDAPHSVAYRLDGPTGLPAEGWWYANKISPDSWSGAGMRDVAITMLEKDGDVRHSLVSASTIVDSIEEAEPLRWDLPLSYIGVDAQYFACVMVPQKERPDDVWFARSTAIVAGELPPKDRRKAANVTFRATSGVHELAAGDDVTHRFRIFAGPKKPSLLATYSTPSANLEELIVYGWFGWVASPMIRILHGFYALVGNYGLAIVLLTVLVRAAMFPLSRKQALNAQKMQELQPEIKKLAEKHKKDLQARQKAQQELFRKHNYNPLSGCLPMFIQLPIFIGLYRALSVDVELRQAPLVSESVGWANNLAAPDMLFYWEPYLPGFLAAPTGWLGPYFNLLPCITIVLFLVQQKMFMPEPTDEQAALQMKIMRYMMVVIGVMFFKVPSGLCVYFIASSLWGIAERKLLPKVTAKKDDAPAPPPAKKPRPARSGSASDGDARRRRKPSKDWK